MIILSKMALQDGFSGHDFEAQSPGEETAGKSCKSLLGALRDHKSQADLKNGKSRDFHWLPNREETQDSDNNLPTSKTGRT